MPDRSRLGPLADKLGITVIQVRADEAIATMPVGGNTQPYGLLHGGASAALAETIGSLAANAHAGEGRRAVGIELSVSHHRAVSEGLVTARARSVHLGSRIATYEISVEDESGRLAATARLTCMIIAA
ncbi:hotdog fold thioesterase [Rarobacter faecitabidus]|uniref:Uncharacterized protein (TIGR00369 family) n=1 Tax=Rarobacter faecitabidus TaxID=13243 RepID=A0A542ZW36_RARFA|nr:hotdog fold thioesterase [Rarobacter faecitabidus]TQL64410.1 uncharacterized protein (TIGR00369 family) [Rarobacter faecitabidus]